MTLMRILTCGILCIICSFLGAQTASVYIDSISIEGNAKTKEKVIIREMGLQAGDEIALTDLEETLRQTERYLMNTGMFTQVKVYFKNWEGDSAKIHLMVEVEEGWYLFPIPLFELADRNFNVWWVEQKRSLQRVNFGMDFTNLNFTGRMDRLKVGAKFGYTRSYSLRYLLPYINKKQTLGLGINISYAQNREVNYATIDNKQEFFQDKDNFLYKRFFADLSFSYRSKIKTFHNFSLTYHQNEVDNLVATELNPNFFLNQNDDQQYFSSQYNFVYDNRDFRPYPISGNYLSLTLEKDGLGLFSDRDGLTFLMLFYQYIPFSTKWSLSLESGGKFSLLRNRQPYNDNRALGYGDYNLHGYEYYVVDGMDMGVLRSSFRYQIFDKVFDFGRVIPLKAYRRMPLKLYLSLNNDVGYVNDPYDIGLNPMNSRLLWGGGLGLDFIVYYDKVFRVEYSFNHLKERGLFLHLNLGI